MQPGIRAAAASGIKWNSVSTVVATAAQFIQVFAVSRLIGPEEFGLYSMVSLVLGFGHIYVDAGVSQGIIHHQPESSEELSSLYWLNLAMGSLVSLVVLVAAPLIAWFFEEPQLIGLLRAASLLFIVIACGQQFQVLAQKELRFALLAKLDIASAVIGASVAIGLAVAGFGAMALVVGTIAAAFAKTTVMAASLWREHRPRAVFVPAHVKKYLQFGSFQLGDKTLNYFNSRIDRTLIGAYLGPEALGYYSLAWFFVVEPIYRINPMVTTVALPIFGKLQKDVAALTRFYAKMVGGLLTVTAPMVVGFVAAAPSLVPLIVGEKWLAAVPLIQILAVVGIIRGIWNPVGSLLMATGNVDRAFYWNVMFVVVQIPLLWWATRYGDIHTVAVTLAAVALAMLASLYPSVIRPILPGSASLLGQAVWPPLAIALTMGALVHGAGLLITWPLAPKAVVLVVLGAALYVGISLAFRREYLEDLRLLVSRR